MVLHENWESVEIQGIADDAGLPWGWGYSGRKVKGRREGGEIRVLSRVPYRARLEMQERIDAMPDGAEKMILKLYCVDEKRTSEIPSCLEDAGYRACSVRLVQMVIKKNFPELTKYRKANRENEKRRGHFKYLRSHEKVACGKCGRSNRLEWHHMIPVDMGGTEDEENMACLCGECHSAVTNWQRRMGLIRKNEVKSDVY